MNEYHQQPAEVGCTCRGRLHLLRSAAPAEVGCTCGIGCEEESNRLFPLYAYTFRHENQCLVTCFSLFSGSSTNPVTESLARSQHSYTSHRFTGTIVALPTQSQGHWHDRSTAIPVTDLLARSLLYQPSHRVTGTIIAHLYQSQIYWHDRCSTNPVTGSLARS